MSGTVRDEVLLKSGRRCCICWGLEHKIATVRGQIAHLDHDRDNHSPENLAFLCLAHHDEYDSTPSQSRGFSRDEVTTYRTSLYEAIAVLKPDVSATPETPRSHVLQSVQGDHNQVTQAINLFPRVVRKSVVQPGNEHVSDAQAFRIRELVLDLSNLEKSAGRDASPGKWYGKLYHQFDITSYKLLKAVRFEEAVTWLQKQRSMLRPQLRRTNNDTWRKGHYAGIWSRAKELGLSKDDVYSLASQRLKLKGPVDSLTSLGERQLESLYRIILSLPRA